MNLTTKIFHMFIIRAKILFRFGEYSRKLIKRKVPIGQQFLIFSTKPIFPINTSNIKIKNKVNKNINETLLKYNL